MKNFKKDTAKEVTEITRQKSVFAETIKVFNKYTIENYISEQKKELYPTLKDNAGKPVKFSKSERNKILFNIMACDYFEPFKEEFENAKDEIIAFTQYFDTMVTLEKDYKKKAEKAVKEVSKKYNLDDTQETLLADFYSKFTSLCLSQVKDKKHENFSILPFKHFYDHYYKVRNDESKKQNAKTEFSQDLKMLLNVSDKLAVEIVKFVTCNALQKNASVKNEKNIMLTLVQAFKAVLVKYCKGYKVKDVRILYKNIQKEVTVYKESEKPKDNISLQMFFDENNIKYSYMDKVKKTIDYAKNINKWDSNNGKKYVIIPVQLENINLLQVEETKTKETK